MTIAPQSPQPRPEATSQRSPRSPRKDAARNETKLIEAAHHVFVDHGVDASLEEVARQAELGIGTLYRHFACREALIAATYRRDIDELCIAADELLATGDPDEALTEWMERFVGQIARRGGMSQALQSILESDGALFEAHRRRLTEAASRILSAGIANGMLRSDITPSDLLRAMAGICLAIETGKWSEQSEPLMRLLCDGLHVTADRPKRSR